MMDPNQVNLQFENPYPNQQQRAEIQLLQHQLSQANERINELQQEKTQYQDQLDDLIALVAKRGQQIRDIEHDLQKISTVNSNEFLSLTQSQQYQRNQHLRQQQQSPDLVYSNTASQDQYQQNRHKNSYNSKWATPIDYRPPHSQRNQIYHHNSSIHSNPQRHSYHINQIRVEDNDYFFNDGASANYNQVAYSQAALPIASPKAVWNSKKKYYHHQNLHQQRRGIEEEDYIHPLPQGQIIQDFQQSNNNLAFVQPNEEVNNMLVTPSKTYSQIGDIHSPGSVELQQDVENLKDGLGNLQKTAPISKILPQNKGELIRKLQQYQEEIENLKKQIQLRNQKLKKIKNNWNVKKKQVKLLEFELQTIRTSVKVLRTNFFSRIRKEIANLKNFVLSNMKLIERETFDNIQSVVMKCNATQNKDKIDEMFKNQEYKDCSPEFLKKEINRIKIQYQSEILRINNQHRRELQLRLQQVSSTQKNNIEKEIKKDFDDVSYLKQQIQKLQKENQHLKQSLSQSIEEKKKIEQSLNGKDDISVQTIRRQQLQKSYKKLSYEMEENKKRYQQQFAKVSQKNENMQKSLANLLNHLNNKNQSYDQLTNQHNKKIISQILQGKDVVEQALIFQNSQDTKEVYIDEKGRKIIRRKDQLKSATKKKKKRIITSNQDNKLMFKLDGGVQVPKASPNLKNSASQSSSSKYSKNKNNYQRDDNRLSYFFMMDF